jgi:hypothetical protein
MTTRVDDDSSSPGKSNTLHRRFVKATRFRLLPEMRKKHSCPALSNVAITDRAPDDATEDIAICWIQNCMERSPSIHRQQSAGGTDSDYSNARSRSLPSFSAPASPSASSARFMLLKEWTGVHMCRVPHERSVVAKLSNSCKLLRRWETHTLLLGIDTITSTTVSDCYLEPPQIFA